MYPAYGINDRAQIVGSCGLFYVLPPPGEPYGEGVLWMLAPAPVPGSNPYRVMSLVSLTR
jgi:hypothetical protein